MAEQVKKEEPKKKVGLLGKLKEDLIGIEKKEIRQEE